MAKKKRRRRFALRREMTKRARQLAREGSTKAEIMESMEDEFGERADAVGFDPSIWISLIMAIIKAIMEFRDDDD